MNTVLITGGAGFIGSRLAIKLFENNYKVIVYDNLSPQIHGINAEDSFNFKIIKDKVTFIKGDINNKTLLKSALNNVDFLYHMVSETGTGQSMYNISDYVKTNLSGTATLLELLLNEKNNIKKFFLTSSRAIYGEGKYKCSNHGIIYPNSRADLDLKQNKFDLYCPNCNSKLILTPTDEECPHKPTSVYGLTKSSQEQLVSLTLKNTNIFYNIFRFQNVYGPGQSLLNPYTGILSIFSNLILNGKNIEVFEDGFESRDFVYIDDIVDALLLPLKINNNYSIYNVGSGVNTNLITIAEKLRYLFNSKVNIGISGRYRIGDIRHSLSDISKIKNELGFVPKVNIEKGLEYYVDWVKTQKIPVNNLDLSLNELKSKGLLK